MPPRQFFGYAKLVNFARWLLGACMSSFFLFSFSFLFIRVLARWFILPFQTKVACSNSALTVVH